MAWLSVKNTWPTFTFTFTLTKWLGAGKARSMELTSSLAELSKSLAVRVG